MNGIATLEARGLRARTQGYTALAPVYDLFAEDMDPVSWGADLAARLHEAGIGKGLIAELGCGTGRITGELLKAGYRVIGFDNSEEMLRAARVNLRAKGFSPVLVRQDMGGFELPRAADAILCACDGMNYLTKKQDVLRVFRHAAARVKPGGVFLFDISSEYKLKELLGSRFFGETREEAAYLWQSRFIAPTRIARMDITFFLKEPDGRYRRGEEVHRQRAHTVEELEHWAKQCGWTVEAVHAAFTRRKPRKDDLRIQFVLRYHG